MVPLTIQVYVNGHDWLARQLQAQKIGFVQQDNAFKECDDWAVAQTLTDQFDQQDWVKLLGGWARRVNWAMAYQWLAGKEYHWVADQVEYSSDLLFTNSAALRELYSRLLDHAALHFAAEDVLSLVGRRLHLSRGFRNTDIRQRLHVCGLIAKIPHTYRQRTTVEGQRSLSTILTLYHHGLSQAA